MIMDDGTTNDLLLVEAMEIVEMVKLIHYWHFSIIHLVHMWSIYNFDYFLLLHVFLGGGVLRLIKLLHISQRDF